MIHAFTSAAANYLPKIRILHRSLLAHHPDIKFHWLLVDAVPDWLDPEAEGFSSVISLADLGILNKPEWIFQHNLIELSTALKPEAFSKLLMDRHCTGVLYFDPDMVIFSRLDNLFEQFDNSSILLTPHQTNPDTELGAVVDNEIGSLRHGIYNLGFLGVKRDKIGKEFVDWWTDRLRYFCLAAYQHGLWVDQRWIDHAPVFFDRVGIVRNPRFNVAAWNVSQRRLSGSLEAGLKVNGQPLGFYHFSGYDSGAHKTMAMKYGGESRALRSLIAWYDQQLANSSLQEHQVEPWAFKSYSDGTTIRYSSRFIYRMRQDLQDSYPNPFQVSGEGDSYLDWVTWREQIEHPDIVDDEGGIRWDAIPNLQIIAPLQRSSWLPSPFGTLVPETRHLLRRTREAYWTSGPWSVLNLVSRRVMHWLRALLEFIRFGSITRRRLTLYRPFSRMEQREDRSTGMSTVKCNESQISDTVYREKFTNLPEIIASWVETETPLEGKRVMDFGCGEGTTALGIALKYSPNKVVGVDINREHEACLSLAQNSLGLEALPENLRFQTIEPGDTGDWDSPFDIIYSWSVFEHINRRFLDEIILQLRDNLSETGILFVQIAPLYYSASGAHLEEFDLPRWGHLLDLESNVKHRVFGDDSQPIEKREAVWSCYESLNKITADELIEIITNLGFSLIREYRTKDEDLPPERLRRIFNVRVLTTNQIVATFRKK